MAGRGAGVHSHGTGPAHPRARLLAWAYGAAYSGTEVGVWCGVFWYCCRRMVRGILVLNWAYGAAYSGTEVCGW
eukprot:94856-Rhodomonas_salina.4